MRILKITNILPFHCIARPLFIPFLFAAERQRIDLLARWNTHLYLNPTTLFDPLVLRKKTLEKLKVPYLFPRTQVYPAVIGRHPVRIPGVPRLNPGSCLSIWIRFILFIIFYDFTPLRRVKVSPFRPRRTLSRIYTRIIRKNLFPRGEIITPSRTFTPSVVSFRRQIKILYGPVGWKFDFHLVPVLPPGPFFPTLSYHCSWPRLSLAF